MFHLLRQRLKVTDFLRHPSHSLQYELDYAKQSGENDSGDTWISIQQLCTIVTIYSQCSGRMDLGGWYV